MRARIVLVIFLVGIIFPMRWLGQISPAYRAALTTIFDPEWVHIITHTALYAGLGASLVVVTRLSACRSSVWILSWIILGVATLQEFFQWLTMVEAIPVTTTLLSSLFDLGVDLLAGWLGMAVAFRVSKMAGRIRPLI